MITEGLYINRAAGGALVTLCLLILTVLPSTPRCEDTRLSLDPAFAAAETHIGKPEQLYVKRTVSYGKVMFVIDGISTAFALIGQAPDTMDLSGLGMAGYLLGGPLVHAGNGNSHKGWWSLGTRLVVPFLAGHAVAAFAPCRSCPQYRVSGIIGSVGGAIGAMAIDQIYFAEKTRFIPYQPSSRSSRSRIADPVVTMSPSGDMAIGMTGRF